MPTTLKQLSIVIATFSALGLSACNKPALQSSATSAGAPATAVTSTPPADPAAVAAAREPLKDMVTAALTAEPGLGAIAVEVNPASGTVTLTGTTNNEENRTKASQIALNVPGVKSVENNLVVKDMT
jgi:hypothetical protein